MDRLRIVPVPMDLVWCDPEQNLLRMEQVLQAWSASVAAITEQTHDKESISTLLVFPELTLTAFAVSKSKEISLLEDGPEVQKARALARQHRVGIVFGYPERNPQAPDRPFNTLLVLDPAGAIVGRYRKIHLFTLGNPSEAQLFTPGDQGTLVHYQGWRIGLSICFDLRFPRLFQAYAGSGVDLLLCPACWVGGPTKSEQFLTMAAAHAIFNQCYFVAVNRTGADPFYQYSGEVGGFDPFGVSGLTESVLPGVESALGGRAELRSIVLERSKLESARKFKIREADRKSYPVVES